MKNGQSTRTCYDVRINSFCETKIVIYCKTVKETVTRTESDYEKCVQVIMIMYVYEHVACNLRTCAVCRLHGAKYAVCRLHGTQSADCMVTVQTKDPSKTCDSFSKFQRNLRFSARINFLTKLPHLKENNLCLFDIGYYSFSCL